MRAMLISLALLLTACSPAESSTENTNVDLAFLLNNQRLVATTPKEIVPPLAVKVYSLTENGECDNGKCPQTQLYIAVSQYGEIPQQTYYVTEKQPNLTFEHWDWMKTTKYSEKRPSVSFVTSHIKNGKKVLETITVDMSDVHYETMSKK
ncbi:conserved hypothetical protein [Photobacterium leiognathi lrivu.4.1]|uniref:Lipoprotein n=1 Tax=Photobacterium leiognathi lrivu.4.1 TaxID=1248232 RepID=V5F8U4_PHOLE|nr:hypothetical protein [Photobacterium leiognathi]GAD31874.1 conserved hypothetical protein [Photobacterium leiognathi lrivu.4.1]